MHALICPLVLRLRNSASLVVGFHCWQYNLVLVCVCVYICSFLWVSMFLCVCRQTNRHLKIWNGSILIPPVKSLRTLLSLANRKPTFLFRDFWDGVQYPPPLSFSFPTLGVIVGPKDIWSPVKMMTLAVFLLGDPIWHSVVRDGFHFDRPMVWVICLLSTIRWDTMTDTSTAITNKKDTE